MVRRNWKSEALTNVVLVWPHYGSAGSSLGLAIPHNERGVRDDDDDDENVLDQLGVPDDPIGTASIRLIGTGMGTLGCGCACKCDWLIRIQIARRGARGTSPSHPSAYLMQALAKHRLALAFRAYYYCYYYCAA